MSEPLWCEVRGHYCRCHDTGKRCDDFDDEDVTEDDTGEDTNVEDSYGR